MYDTCTLISMIAHICDRVNKFSHSITNRSNGMPIRSFKAQPSCIPHLRWLAVTLPHLATGAGFLWAISIAHYCAQYQS